MDNWKRTDGQSVPTGESRSTEYDARPTDSPHYAARRLTPLECCRLQGFPDNWCEGIPHADSAEYKMWGNGIALPTALYVMEGIKEALDD